MIVGSGNNACKERCLRLSAAGEADAFRSRMNALVVDLTLGLLAENPLELSGRMKSRDWSGLSMSGMRSGNAAGFRGLSSTSSPLARMKLATFGGTLGLVTAGEIGGSLGRKNEFAIVGVSGGVCEVPALPTSRLFASKGPRVLLLFSGTPLPPTTVRDLPLTMGVVPCFNEVVAGRDAELVDIGCVFSGFGLRTADLGVTLDPVNLAGGGGVLVDMLA